MMSSHARADRLDVGRHTVENRPRSKWYFRSGIRHHIGLILYGMTVMIEAFRRKARVVVADSGTTHWIMFAPLWLLQIPIVAVLHNTIWPMGYPPTRLLDRFFRRLDGWFFRHIASVTICVSPECERQVKSVAGKPKGPVLQCRLQYREGFLERVQVAPEPPLHPLHVLFLGRVEASKGVFLILDLAEQLEGQMPGSFAWRIVGSGSVEAELACKIKDRGLSGLVTLDGILSGEEQALQILGWAHAVIVPTTSRFIEGLAMTAVEAVLAGRPAVVSSVVPAWEVLGDAVIKADTDNIESFAEAIRKLAGNVEAYRSCLRAGSSVKGQFYDRSRGPGAVIVRAISSMR